MANPFKSKVNQKNFSRPEGAGNFDNMDDHNVVKTTALLQGNIQHTPTLAKDIVNKEYVDSEITDLTTSHLADHPHQDVTTTASPSFAGDVDIGGSLEVGTFGVTETFKLKTQGGASRFTLETADSLGIFSTVKNLHGEWAFGMLSTEAFIVRDITSGNIVVMRINQGAPLESIYIDGDGDIGFGRNPQSGYRLQIVTPSTDANLLLMKTNGDTVFTGSIASGTTTFSTTGPTDNVDVGGVNTLFIDSTSNAVTIGGFANGVAGQVLYITKQTASANAVTLEHAEGGGSQDILLHAGADETLTSEYGGWVLICDGTHWHDCSHSKHV